MYMYQHHMQQQPASAMEVPSGLWLPQNGASVAPSGPVMTASVNESSAGLEATGTDVFSEQGFFVEDASQRQTSKSARR